MQKETLTEVVIIHLLKNIKQGEDNPNRTRKQTKLNREETQQENRNTQEDKLITSEIHGDHEYE